MWQLSQRMRSGTCKAGAPAHGCRSGGGERRVAEGCPPFRRSSDNRDRSPSSPASWPDRRRRRHASSWWNLSLASGNSRSSRGEIELRVPQRRSGPLRSVALLARLEVVTSCNRESCRLRPLTHASTLGCSANRSHGRRGNWPFPRRERRRSHSTARVLRRGRIRRGVSGVLGPQRVAKQMQSTFVEAPVVCAAPAAKLPGTFTGQGLPARERPSRRSGRRRDRTPWLFHRRGDSSGNSPYPGSGSDPDQRVPGDDLVRRLAVAADAGPLAEVLRERLVAPRHHREPRTSDASP